MSAGRLQVFDKRASLKDRASRVLIRLADGRELRLREFGTKQRAWAKLSAPGEVEADEMVATLGPEAWPAPPLEELAAAVDQPRQLHPLLRDQRAIAGIGRSWVDEVLWEARLGAVQEGLGARATRRSSACTTASPCSATRSTTTRRWSASEVPDKLPMPLQGPPPRGRAVPALRDDDRGRLLRRAPDELLPDRARPAAGCSRTAASRGC